LTNISKDQSAADTLGMLGKMPFNPMNDPQLKVWSDLGAEVMQFASSRMQQDIEAQKSMLACKSLAELQKVQADYYSEALKDYTAQIQRAMAVMSGASGKQTDDGFKATKRGYDDVPL
jgi:hypothetical protein